MKLQIPIYVMALTILVGQASPAGAGTAESNTPKENYTWLVGNAPDSGPQAASVYDRLMDQLWRGTASFRPYVSFQIQTIPDKGQPFFNGMNEGTQIVPMDGAWYLFSREYDFAPRPPGCSRDFSRIVVRKSTDLGHTWSKEVVIAQPNLARGECALGDGYAYWDNDTQTWHYLSQMLSNRAIWNVDHFERRGADPLGKFEPDPGNPIVTGGMLWSRICGSGKLCPTGTADEGTPEIIRKANGYYYVTFHGAHVVHGPPTIVFGYRGIAKTRDWHRWLPVDTIPGGVIWSRQDCQNWKVPWNPQTGCIGGGHASTLVTPTYTYMLIESADTTLQCKAGQLWTVGLVRAPSVQESGHWQQWPGNPLLKNDNGSSCSVQYPRFFIDRGHIFLTYWTLGPSGSHDANTYFRIVELVPNAAD